jgi:RNA-directed DNA polymerase
VAAEEAKSEDDQLLMEQVVERSNMWRAYRRVVSNRGAPGVDDLTVAELFDWLKAHWPVVKEALLAGRYVPRAVRRVDIPKPQGGVRTLGVPTVVDRLIQQALHQVLQPIFEPGFSDASYGFRPGRDATQAVRAAQGYIRDGKRWVVDIDLEQFFDRVNHDMLMARVARRVRDRRVLKLIRRFLEAGMMADGLIQARTEGTPQGGPLSPLLSNILLTDLDRELEKRNLAFCRYADDCNIYVASEAAGQRVMTSIRTFLEKALKLRVNAAKSAVARPWNRKFLGYSFSNEFASRLRVAPASTQRLKQRLRKQFRKASGRAMRRTIEELNPLLRGWMMYFRYMQTPRVLRVLDGWIRHHLRVLHWRQWKTHGARMRHLVHLGLTPSNAATLAWSHYGPWRTSCTRGMHAALSRAYFTNMGLVSLLDTQQRLQRVA